MKRADGIYSVDDLLLAYRRHAGRPLYGLLAYRQWNDDVLAAVSRAFGVSFEEGEQSAETRALLGSLREVLEADVTLPHPTRDFLEDTLINVRYEPFMDALATRARALHAFYGRVARDLAGALWGELGTRTDAELAAAGLDFTREPRLADHLDDI